MQDADAAVRWARGDGAAQLGHDAGHVLVGGDSAGGNLAAVAALHAREDGLPALRGQLLVYPALDPEMDSDAYREFVDGPGLSREEMAVCWSTYLDGADPADADVSPLRADLAGAPRSAIAVAGVDPLRDDGLRYAEALSAAGVPVDVEVFGDVIHGFLRWGGVVDRTGELVALAGRPRTRGAGRSRACVRAARTALASPACAASRSACRPSPPRRCCSPAAAPTLHRRPPRARTRCARPWP